MSVTQQEVAEWLAAHCRTCLKRTDTLWLNERCPHLRRILWNGPPYNEADSDAIEANIRLGGCPYREQKKSGRDESGKSG